VEVDTSLRHILVTRERRSKVRRSFVIALVRGNNSHLLETKIIGIIFHTLGGVGNKGSPIQIFSREDPCHRAIILREAKGPHGNFDCLSQVRGADRTGTYLHRQPVRDERGRFFTHPWTQCRYLYPHPTLLERILHIDNPTFEMASKLH